MITSRSLRARETAWHYGQRMTFRGDVPSKVAPMRRFYKRLARRVERHAARVDVAAEMLAVTCAGCHRVGCEDFWCETYAPTQRAALEAEARQIHEDIASLLEDITIRDERVLFADDAPSDFEDEGMQAAVWDEIREARAEGYLW